jgi:hypothetical protein
MPFSSFFLEIKRVLQWWEKLIWFDLKYSAYISYLIRYFPFLRVYLINVSLNKMACLFRLRFKGFLEVVWDNLFNLSLSNIRVNEEFR